MTRETSPWLIAEPHLVRRCDALLKAVGRCCDSVDCDENIHKLRVASRRLEAALNAFDSLLCGNQLRRVRKHVQRIRRAAGSIRDLDVLILRLRADPDALQVIAPLREQRRQLAAGLMTRFSERDRRRLGRDLDRLIVTDPAPQTATDLGTWAAEQVQPAACRFLDAADENVRKIKDLHRLRLCGKRLRYSLELFRNELDRERVACLLNSLRAIQERLGEMNDHASARSLLDGFAEFAPDRDVREAALKLARREKRLIKRDRRRFLKWWREGASGQIAECVQKTVLLEATVPDDCP